MAEIGEITFRLLTDDDLPLLTEWLNDPSVKRWWEGEDVSPEAVAANYAPHIDDATEPWLVFVDGEAFAWIQWWPISAYPEETEDWPDFGLPEESTVGIDLLIGEPSRRGAGLGKAMIAAFVTELFRQQPAVTHIAASPFAANEASVGMAKAVGFDVLGEIAYPQVWNAPDDGPCTLVAISRDRVNEQ